MSSTELTKNMQNCSQIMTKSLFFDKALNKIRDYVSLQGLDKNDNSKNTQKINNRNSNNSNVNKKKKAEYSKLSILSKMSVGSTKITSKSCGSAFPQKKTQRYKLYKINNIQNKQRKNYDSSFHNWCSQMPKKQPQFSKHRKNNQAQINSQYKGSTGQAEKLAQIKYSQIKSKSICQKRLTDNKDRTISKKKLKKKQNKQKKTKRRNCLDRSRYFKNSANNKTTKLSRNQLINLCQQGVSIGQFDCKKVKKQERPRKHKHLQHCQKLNNNNNDNNDGKGRDANILIYSVSDYKRSGFDGQSDLSSKSQSSGCHHRNTRNTRNKQTRYNLDQSAFDLLSCIAPHRSRKFVSCNKKGKIGHHCIQNNQKNMPKYINTGMDKYSVGSAVKKRGSCQEKQQYQFTNQPLYSSAFVGQIAHNCLQNQKCTPVEHAIDADAQNQTNFQILQSSSSQCFDENILQNGQNSLLTFQATPQDHSRAVSSHHGIEFTYDKIAKVLANYKRQCKFLRRQCKKYKKKYNDTLTQLNHLSSSFKQSSLFSSKRRKNCQRQ